MKRQFVLYNKTLYLNMQYAKILSYGSRRTLNKSGHWGMIKCTLSGVQTHDAFLTGSRAI